MFKTMCRTKTGGKMHRRLSATSARTFCGARAEVNISDIRGAIPCDSCWGDGAMDVARGDRQRVLGATVRPSKSEKIANSARRAAEVGQWAEAATKMLAAADASDFLSDERAVYQKLAAFYGRCGSRS